MQIDSRALEPVFKRGFLGMGVMSTGVVIRFKLSWYECFGVKCIELWWYDSVQPSG